MAGPRVLCVVPARGGSVRLPAKNIAPFAGRPLIGHVLDVAQGSGLFDLVHVSTDSQEIADVAAAFGAAPEFLRDPELADAHTGLRPVLRWVVGELTRRGSEFDHVCLLFATAPLLDAGDLRRGLDRHLEHDLGMTLSVCRFPVPSQWALRRGADDVLSPVDPGALERRSQDLEETFYDTGGFGFFRLPALLDPDRDGDPFVGVEVAPWKAVDIDDERDRRFAEIIWHGLRAVEAHVD